MDLVEEIYKVTNKFPSSELYALTNQLRRAALSVALNIAEGSDASSDLEFSRFLGISLRSSYEVMCGIEISKRLNYCDDKNVNELLKRCDELSAMLSGLRKKIKLKADI